MSEPNIWDPNFVPQQDQSFVEGLQPNFTGQSMSAYPYAQYLCWPMLQPQSVHDYYYRHHQRHLSLQQLLLWSQQQSLYLARFRAQPHYSQLTSFLELENSFLVPWNWDPDDYKEIEYNRVNQRMVFQPGSFFSYDDTMTDTGRDGRQEEGQSPQDRTVENTQNS